MLWRKDMLMIIESEELIVHCWKLSWCMLTQISYLWLVMCMAWPQAKSQAKPHRPGQAKPKVLAWSWLWPGLDFLKAKANGPGHGFELNILRKLLPSELLQ